MYNLKVFWIFITTLLLIIGGCSSQPEREIITLGKTVKIQYTGISEPNLSYRWSYQNIPINSTPKLLIDNNKALFTPDIIGDYDISLSICNESDDEITSELYYFSVTEDTVTKKKTEILQTPEVAEIPINEITKQEEETTKKLIRREKPKQSGPKLDIPAIVGKFTIQVASRPSLEEARSEQLSLIDAGYDAYLQRIFIKEKDEVWWRVRVGAFSDYYIAEAVHKQLLEICGKYIWIDFVRKEQK